MNFKVFTFFSFHPFLVLLPVEVFHDDVVVMNSTIVCKSQYLSLKEWRRKKSLHIEYVLTIHRHWKIVLSKIFAHCVYATTTTAAFTDPPLFLIKLHHNVIFSYCRLWLRVRVSVNANILRKLEMKSAFYWDLIFQ